MAKPRSLALSAICLKTSDKSHMPSMVKLGECFLKYSFLATLTRLVSQLNASEQFWLSTFYQGLGLGGPSAVVLDMVPLKGMLFTGCGEVSHLLGLGGCSGASAGGTAEADGCLAGEAPCDKENG